MSTVESALGPIDAADLGQTLMHEHVFVLNDEIETNYPGRWNEDERMADALQKFRDLAARGVKTLVDLTVIGLGRYIPRVVKVAEQVDVQILVATGLYTYSDVPMFFRHRGPGRLVGGPELLTEFFVQDIDEGIADTGVKAAIIKCATDENGVTEGVERVLRSAARAHLATGAPISTHTHARSERGLDQQAIFRDEGVDLRRVVIGHSGDTTDLVYLRKLMDAGSYIGMDRFGLDSMLSFDQRVDTVVTLCAEGYADRMVLSHDASCYTHNFEVNVKEELLPRWRYTHLHDDVLPALLARGVTEAQIDQMLVNNPQNILARGSDRAHLIRV